MSSECKGIRKKLLQALNQMGFKRSKVNSCLWFKWTDKGLVLIISWIDDLLITGLKELVLETVALMEVDNKDAVDLANNCSNGEQLRHVEMRFWLLTQVERRWYPDVEVDSNGAYVFRQVYEELSWSIV